MQRKRTYWEEIHEDVISDDLQVVESQVMYNFICVFSKSSLVNTNYLQKEKANIEKNQNKTKKDSTRQNKSKQIRP